MNRSIKELQEKKSLLLKLKKEKEEQQKLEAEIFELENPRLSKIKRKFKGLILD